MNIELTLPDGTHVTRVELGHSRIDVLTLTFTIPVELYTESGDRVSVIEHTVTLSTLPIPTPDAQWALVLPRLEALQQIMP